MEKEKQAILELQHKSQATTVDRWTKKQKAALWIRTALLGGVKGGFRITSSG